jgi:hypothetical protein
MTRTLTLLIFNTPPSMLRWLSLALVFAVTHATFADPSLQFNEPGDALQQCQGRAWVRAPDMVPGDVKVKLI